MYIYSIYICLYMYIYRHINIDVHDVGVFCIVFDGVQLFLFVFNCF